MEINDVVAVSVALMQSFDEGISLAYKGHIKVQRTYGPVADGHAVRAIQTINPGQHWWHSGTSFSFLSISAYTHFTFSNTRKWFELDTCVFSAHTLFCLHSKAMYLNERRQRRGQRIIFINSYLTFSVGICLACSGARALDCCNRWDRKKSSTSNSFSFRLCQTYCLKNIYLFIFESFFFSRRCSSETLLLFVGWVASEQISI